MLTALARNTQKTAIAFAMAVFCCSGPMPGDDDVADIHHDTVTDVSDVSLPDTSDVDVPDAAFDTPLPDVRDGADVEGEDVSLDLPPSSVAFVQPMAGAASRETFGFEVVTNVTGVDDVTFRVVELNSTIRTDSFPPYAAIWDVTALPDGLYTVEAVARSAAESALATISVRVDHTGPAITLLGPADTGEPVIGNEMPIDVDVVDPTGVYDVTLTWLGDFRTLRPPDYRTTLPIAQGVDVTVTAIATDRLGNVSRIDAQFAACAEGAVQCDTACVVPETFVENASHCGGCDIACQSGSEVCEDSACVCAEGLTPCDDSCVNPLADPSHCGGCGIACDEGEACGSGTCYAPTDDEQQYIGTGRFFMGSTEDEFGANPSIEYQLDVTITQPYAIDLTEVTQGEWESYFDVNPSSFWDCGTDCPVENVTWFDAVAFANARSEAEGLPPCYDLSDCNDAAPGNGFLCVTVGVTKLSGDPLDCEGYRLPTEAEWEFAYRAGNTSSTHAGDLASNACDGLGFLASVAWFSCNARGTTHPVATRTPNGYGLYDMAGNVFEWTGDNWRSEVTIDAERDPQGGEIDLERAIKGGGWNELASRLRAGARLSMVPNNATPWLGFRLARSVDTVAP